MRITLRLSRGSPPHPFSPSELTGGARKKGNRNKGNNRGNNKGNNRGNKGNNRNGDSAMKDNLCDIIANYKEDEIKDPELKFKKLSNVDLWYDRFLAQFPTEQLERLREDARNISIPASIINIVSVVSNLSKQIKDRRPTLKGKIDNLRITQEIDKDRFKPCDNLTAELDPSDEYGHRSLFESRNLCYRVSPALHQILSLNRRNLHEAAKRYLRNKKNFVDPLVEEFFYRLDYSYTSSKFYAYFNSSSYGLIVMPFKIIKPSSATDGYVDILDPETSDPARDTTVTIFNGTEADMARYVGDSSRPPVNLMPTQAPGGYYAVGGNKNRSKSRLNTGGKRPRRTAVRRQHPHPAKPK